MSALPMPYTGNTDPSHDHPLHNIVEIIEEPEKTEEPAPDNI